MARNLDLLRGGNRYLKTAAYGHFGRDDLDVFTWEKVPPTPPPPTRHTRIMRTHIGTTLRKSLQLRVPSSVPCYTAAKQHICKTHCIALLLPCVCFRQVCCHYIVSPDPSHARACAEQVIPL